MDHPLLQHKLSILRDENTGVKDFREVVSEIATLMCYEATRDLPLEEVEIKTPITTAKFKTIAGKKLAIVPVLRAGLGMVDGILDLIPSAKVGHIGLYRDETTHEPHEYFCKLPRPIDQRVIVVTDPMLATADTNTVLMELAPPLTRIYAQADYFKQCTVTFRCTGSDSNFYTMLDDLAAQYPSVQLKSVQIDHAAYTNASGATTNTATYTVQLNVILCDKESVVS